MTALRSPLRSPLQPALRSPFEARVGVGSRVLDFASLTAVQLQSRFGWTRSGAGTMTDVVGSVQYGAHNLALQSNNFLATWFAQGVAVSTAATAGPARAPVATKISADAASTNYHGVRQGFSLVAGQKYTFSFFARQNGVNRVMLYEDTNVGWWSIIDLSSGAVVANHLGAVGAVVADEQGGRLCTVTVTATTTGVHVVYVKPLPSAQIDNSAYSGNSVDGIDIAAFQLNLGSTALTYVPTTTAPVFLMRTPDYTHGVPGLLLEGARTNLLANTEDLTQAAWLKQQATAPNATTIQEDSSTAALHRVVQVLTGATGAYSFTGWVGAGTRTFAQVSMSDNATGAAGLDINLTTGATNTVSTGSWTNVQASAVAKTLLGVAGWAFRISGTKGAGSQVVGQVNIATGMGTISYDGNGTGNIRATRLQLEAGAYPTSYIPNATTGTLLRVADVADIGPGPEFDALRPAGQGTIVVEWVDMGSTDGDILALHSGGTTNELLSLYYSGSSILTLCRAGSANQIAATLGTRIPNALNKAAISYGAGGLSVVLNGGTVQSNGSATIPAPTHARIAGTALASSAQGARKLTKITTLTTQRTGAALQELSFVQHVPPLDVLSNAAAAYSTRLLRTAYTGPAIRVRRSSDNAEINIGFTSVGNLDTAALLGFAGVNSAFVTVMYDQSGSGRDATQTTIADQPRIVNAGVLQTLNGRPTIDQVTVNGRLNIPAFSGMTSAIVSAVYARFGTGFAPWQFNQVDHLPWINTFAYAGPFSATRRQFGVWPAVSQVLIVASAVQTGTALEIYRNGTQNGTTQASAFALPSDQGNRTIFGGLSGSGFVSELIVLSDWGGGPTNRQILQNSQAAYFGIAIS